MKAKSTTRVKRCSNCQQYRPVEPPHFHARSRLCGPCRNRKGRDKYNPLKDKNRQFKYRYGISLEQYETMSAEQEHKCFLCGEQKKLVVDHCHTTGHIRRLLCHYCNMIVGIAENYPERLQAVQAYIK